MTMSDELFAEPSAVLSAVSENRIKAHIQALEGVRHPLAAPAALVRAAAYIRDSAGNLGYEIAEHSFVDSGSEFVNIIATRPGKVNPEKRVLVLAHYDTVSTSPGADDNASGIALLLELATLLRPLSFDRTIQFVAVSLEENEREGDPSALGRRGSRALSAFARENHWDIEGVVVLEAVAFAGDSVVQGAPAGLPVKVPAIGNFLAVIGNSDSASLVQEFESTVVRWQIPLPCQSLIVPGGGEALPDTRRSDHASFWDAGYRAIMLTDTTNFRNPHYHRPSDTLATLNLAFAAEVCRATAALVMTTAGVHGH